MGTHNSINILILRVRPFMVPWPIINTKDSIWTSLPCNTQTALSPRRIFLGTVLHWEWVNSSALQILVKTRILIIHKIMEACKIAVALIRKDRYLIRWVGGKAVQAPSKISSYPHIMVRQPRKYWTFQTPTWSSTITIRVWSSRTCSIP